MTEGVFEMIVLDSASAFLGFAFASFCASMRRAESAGAIVRFWTCESEQGILKLLARSPILYAAQAVRETRKGKRWSFCREFLEGFPQAFKIFDVAYTIWYVLLGPLMSPSNALQKIKALSRPAQAPGEAVKVPRNLDPALHPFEGAREYTRAHNAVKLERMVCSLM